MQDPTPDNDGRAWEWQSCVEFGFFAGSYPPASPFMYVNVEPQIKWCEQIFGIPGMTPNVEWTNTYYGGYNLQATNVLFTNGLIDPWHLLSIIESKGTNPPFNAFGAVTYEAGHCASMIATTSMDPPSLTQARQNVFDFISQLIENYKNQ